MLNNAKPQGNERIKGDQALHTDGGQARHSATKTADKKHGGQAFLDLLGIKLSKVLLSDLWPLKGPVWDGLDKFKTGKVFSADFISRLF